MKKVNNREDLLLLTNSNSGKLNSKHIDDSYTFCKQIAINNYENFPVGSILIPSNLRPHFFSIYAFSRIADDIADESFIENRDEKLASLNRMIDMVENKVKYQETQNPVFSALYKTILEKNIPNEPFIKLINAFKQDVMFQQPENWDDVLDYCNKSANPIGELVLRLFDNYDETTSKKSDAICTGLQLINFWQDLSIDMKRGRFYIPKIVLQKNNITIYNEKLIGKKDNINKSLNELYDFTEKFYKFGFNLINNIKNKRLKLELKLTMQGGDLVLNKIKNLGIDILDKRPKLNKIDYFLILLKATK